MNEEVVSAARLLEAASSSNEAGRRIIMGRILLMVMDGLCDANDSASIQQPPETKRYLLLLSDAMAAAGDERR